MSLLRFKSWWEDKGSLASVRDYIYSHGLLIASHTDSLRSFSISLKPSPFPESQFKHVVGIQTSLNSIVDAISKDDAFLRDSFSRIIKADAFTGRLFEILDEQIAKGNVQTTALGLYRSDYLVDVQRSHDGRVTLGIKLVEINTISTSLASHSYKVTELHNYIHSRYSPDTHYKPLDNQCLIGLVDGLATAWKEYGDDNAVVLFVVNSQEKNIFDHRVMEYDLWNRYSIASMRKTLAQVADEIQITPSRAAVIDGKEIAVAYYRVGYNPEHYTSEKEWTARRSLELSKASNCPSVAYQLVGLKKVQQVLAAPGILERYCTDPQIIKDIRYTFTGQYSLDQSPEGDATVKMALNNPDGFVMKPQREGGGHNLFKEELKTRLVEMSSSKEREQYILMDLINAPSFPGCILKSSESVPTEIPVISELGIYGAFVRKGDNVLLNTNLGHLVRTKPLGVGEGGVAIGVASLDSPWLLSDEDYISQL